MRRDLRGHSWKGEVKEIGADGFSIHFEMPKGFVLPNYNFTSFNVTVEDTSGQWNYSALQKDFGSPLALTFGGQREGEGVSHWIRKFQN